MYGASNVLGPSSWTNYGPYRYSGVHSDNTVSATTAFPIATAYVTAGFLVNYPTSPTDATSVQKFANVAFYEVVNDSTKLLKAGDTMTGALGVTTIEVGHASDTTLSRVSAGRIAVEGVNIPTVSSTDTFTNKTIGSAGAGFAGSTSGTTTLKAAATAGTNTLTLPATTTDTLVGRTTTDTLTNKTISGASNTISNVSADSTVDGTVNKVYTATEKTKLAGIASGATANDSDANLKNRANHTGTQTLSTISDVTATATEVNYTDGVTSAIQTQLDGKASTSALAATSYSQSFPRSLPVAVEQMDSGWTDEYGNGTVGHDTSDYFEGTGSIKVITPTNTLAAGMSKAVSYDLSSRNFKIWIKSSNWANVDLAQIFFETSSGNYYYIDMHQYFQDLTNNEWYDCQLTRGRFASNGSPNWASITKIIVRATSPSGQSSTVWFDGLQILPQAAKPAISIAFDDSRITGYTKGASYMSSKGMVGSVFAIPSLLGTTNYMSQAQIDDLAKKGWDISGHGDTDLTTLTLTQAETDLQSVALWLKDHGYPGSNVYAYPNGSNTNAVRGLVNKYFPVARTINYINQPLGNVSPMRLNALSPISSWTYANIKAYIDWAVANNEWLVLTFHNIADTPTVSTEIATTTFNQVIDYIAGLGVDVLPVSRVLGLDWQTTVPSGTILTQTNSVAGITNKTIGGAGVGFAGSTSGTTTLKAAAAAGTNTLTLPPTTNDTLVGRASTDTITGTKNFSSGTFKHFGSTSGAITVNAPATAGTNTWTWQAATDTVVGRATTDTLTNKTLTSPKITSGNAPATSSSTGTAGQVEFDANYIYVCTATNTWKRSALSTW